MKKTFYLLPFLIFLLSCSNITEYILELGNATSLSLSVRKGPDTLKKIKFNGPSCVTELEWKSKVSELDIHLDEYVFESEWRDLLMIYDLYSGWAILDRETCKIYKDFGEIPEGEQLLKKLALMGKPAWVFDGEEFKKN